MNSSTAEQQAVAVLIRLSGNVQGSGIRPDIARLAMQLQLSGSVRNCRRGVDVEVIGYLRTIEDFTWKLREIAPTARLNCSELAPVSEPVQSTFRIIDSNTEGAACFVVPLDRVTCRDCIDECMTPGNRRFGYSLNSCARCGPRYSIIRAMPYDRSRTCMSAFPMCAECQAEYDDPANRRFHAQTTCCLNCGPEIRFESPARKPEFIQTEAINAAAKALLAGQILALKGIGGYQLMCDATSEACVARLRHRKGRAKKPFAVMVDSLETARGIARIDSLEAKALASSAGPIVLVRAKAGSSLAARVHSGLSDVGLMLPTSALHAWLLAQVRRPLVVTSGNCEGEPLEYQEGQATARLGGVADCFLHHNRPIIRPIDDSVVRCMADRLVTIRAARGIAPIQLNCTPNSHILALSGQQKAAVALSNGNSSVLGPHVGDLSSLSSRNRYGEQQQALAELMNCSPIAIARDLHPDYFTTAWSRELRKSRTDCIQHHHAHVVAGMVEHRWLDRTVLGFAFDGTGAGDDGTIWGSEVLLSTVSDYQRVAHLRSFRLVGGEAAIQEPWRVAVSLLTDAVGADAEQIATILEQDVAKIRSVRRLLEVDSVSPSTTSMGRLFDGVAALICGACVSNYEGEAAMLLESACSQHAQGAYTIVIEAAEPLQMDWRPMLVELISDLLCGVDRKVMAMRFHRAIANCIVQLAIRFPQFPVVLTGGVFQNRVLVELVAAQLADHSSAVGLPGGIPPNDGGLAVGQLAVAAGLIERQRSCV